MDVNQRSRNEYIHRINRVVDYIEANLAEEHSLVNLAKVAYFSPFHFHRIFFALVGETLSQFIQRVRLEKAASRLVSDPAESLTVRVQSPLIDSPLGQAFGARLVDAVGVAQHLLDRVQRAVHHVGDLRLGLALHHVEHDQRVRAVRHLGVRWPR